MTSVFVRYCCVYGQFCLKRLSHVINRSLLKRKDPLHILKGWHTHTKSFLKDAIT